MFTVTVKHLLSRSKTLPLFSLLLMLSFLTSTHPIFALEVINHEILNFNANISDIGDDEVHFSSQAFESSEFQKNLFSYNDILNETKIDGAIIVAKKSVFTVSVPSAFFAEKLISDISFINKTIDNGSVTKMGKKTYHVKKQSTIALGITINLTGTLYPYYYPSPTQLESFTDKHLSDILKLDKELGQPDKIILLYLGDVSGYLYNGYTVLKVYTRGSEKTMVVMNQIFTISPKDFWPVPRYLVKSRSLGIGTGEYFAINGLKDYQE